MTITEYMNDIALESVCVANEMACDAMLCAYYESTTDDEEAFANESSALNLAFDDEDTFTDIEPATEKAGFFKSLGNKFKNVIETVKGWFEKIAKTIKEWITKFIGSVKDKIAAFHNRQSAKNKAGLQADIDTTESDINKKLAEFNKRKEELEKKLNDPKTENKDKIQTQLEELGKTIRAYEAKSKEKIDSLKLKYGKEVAVEMQRAMKIANGAFTVASNSEKTILKMLSDIMKTKQGSSSTADTIGSKLGYNAVNQSLTYNKDADASVSDDELKKDAQLLAKVKKGDAEKYLKQLEKITESVDKQQVELESAVESHAKAYSEFVEKIPSYETQVLILSKVGGAVPAKNITEAAERMEKECTALASSTQSLSNVVAYATGNENAAMAKVMSSYSNVASKIAKIATEYLKLGTKGQAAAVAASISAAIVNKLA